MSNKVIFLRSQLPRTDSRLQRYLGVLKQYKKDYIVIGWDREGVENGSDDEILYQKAAKVGGGFSNILSLILWNLFILMMLIKIRKKYSVIHSVDFDTIIPALLTAKVLRKKLIFDVYDKYTDARKMPTKIATVIDKLERWGCMSCDELILPDKCRFVQLGLPKTTKATIIENVPVYTKAAEDSVRQFEVDCDGLILSYVGILEAKHRGLEDLLSVVSSNPSICFYIAGDGPLRDTVIEYAQKYNNIHYHGSVSPEQALSIMTSSHIIVGMYYKTIPNHLFASPNKYYEHLMLGKALLTTENTPPGDKVELYGTGYAVKEGEKALADWVEEVCVDSAKKFGISAQLRWDKFYKNYSVERLEKPYLRLVG